MEANMIVPIGVAFERLVKVSEVFTWTERTTDHGVVQVDAPPGVIRQLEKCVHKDFGLVTYRAVSAFSIVLFISPLANPKKVRKCIKRYVLGLAKKEVKNLKKEYKVQKANSVVGTTAKRKAK